MLDGLAFVVAGRHGCRGRPRSRTRSAAAQRGRAATFAARMAASASSSVAVSKSASKRPLTPPSTTKSSFVAALRARKTSAASAPRRCRVTVPPLPRAATRAAGAAGFGVHTEATSESEHRPGPRVLLLLVALLEPQRRRERLAVAARREVELRDVEAARLQRRFQRRARGCAEEHAVDARLLAGAHLRQRDRFLSDRVREQADGVEKAARGRAAAPARRSWP